MSTPNQDNRTYPLERQLSLIAPNEYNPIEDKALPKLLQFAHDKTDFDKLIEILGLGDALCRMKSNLVT